MTISIDRWLDHWADHSPDKVGIEFEDQRLTYSDLTDAVGQMTSTLVGVGVGRSDRVAFLGGDGPLPLVLLFACARLGAIYVPLNTRLVPAELSWIIEHADPAVVLTDVDFAEVLAESVAGSTRVCAVLAGPPTAGLDSLELSTQSVTGTKGSGGPALMCYTSGTTGRPKGAILTHEALLANATNVHAMMDMTSHDRVLNTMPLFHVGGLNVHSLPTLAAGGTIVLHPRFDPARVLAELTAGDVDLVTLLPPMLVAVLALPAFTDADLTSLRAVNTGAAMVPAPLIEAIHAKGVPVTQIYGLTETATLATCLRREHAYERIGSCGKGALTCEVMLVDDEGQQVPTGSPGEIVTRGPNVLHEYWRDTDATDAAFLDGGWFRTGDVATADEDGFLYMQDRKKDMIISGGENIYPAELEELLVGVPGLAEAAVIGRPDNTWGEVPVVVAVRQPESSTTDEDVLAVFVDRVARFKRPKEVIWVGSLPRTAMGKVQKHVLRNDLT